MAISSSGHDYYWEVVQSYAALLREYFSPSRVVADLCPVIKHEGMMQVNETAKTSKQDGVDKLLELLKASGYPGWFEAFIEALKNNGYDLLADHLSGTRELKDSGIFKELTGVFCKHIVETVDPREITLFLLQKGTITKEDCQEIQDVSKGDPRSGIFLLLYFLPQHVNHWFPDFIAALRHVGTPAYDALAADIEPAVYKACGNQNEREVADKFQALNQSLLASKSTDKHTSKATSSLQVTDIENATVTEFHQEYEEMDTEMTPLGAGTNTISKQYPYGEHNAPLAMSSPNIPVENLCHSAIAQSVNMESNWTLSNKCSTSKSINDLSEPSSTKIIREYTLNVAGDLANDGHRGSKVLGNEMPTDRRRECQRQANCNEENKPKPLELHSYQEELAEPALNDKNVIIVAPYGSGKTQIALYIIQKHLFKPGRRRVVFFVPTTELVSQQTRTYLTYLSAYKIFGISGQVQDSQKLPITTLIDNNDILVMTPQIFLNALQKKDVLSLSIFTLMIFDECHLATREHPYSNIMAVYLDEKFREDIDYCLPQIVGLTASVGVGGARDTDGATEHLLSLCANLDAIDGISVVEKHRKELEQFVNKPHEKKIETHGRWKDPFRDTINKVMDIVEVRIRNHIDKQNLRQLSPLMDIPAAQRGNDEYTQWLCRLHRETAKIYEQNIRRPIYTCRAHLIIYNTALMINEDCRTAESLSYLLTEFQNIVPQYKDETDCWLESLFNRQRNDLRCISEDPQYANPKLTKLSVLLLENYKANEDMRVIIFCKTREITIALQKWLEETPELAVMSPKCLVRIKASAEKGGVIQDKQDVLTYFKGGKYKVIVATSATEEGLDVSKCNLVIRYEYIHNEITVVRARGDHSRSAAQKEELNKIKENMMNKAIQVVNGMSDGKRRQNILELQQKTMEQRKMNDVARK